MILSIREFIYVINLFQVLLYKSYIRQGYKLFRSAIIVKISDYESKKTR